MLDCPAKMKTLTGWVGSAPNEDTPNRSIYMVPRNLDPTEQQFAFCAGFIFGADSQPSATGTQSLLDGQRAEAGRGYPFEEIWRIEAGGFHTRPMRRLPFLLARGSWGARAEKAASSFCGR